MLAPAKINLDLTVTGRRADGYHELDSTVVFAAFGDHLTLKPGGGRLAIDGPYGSGLGITNNLVLRAANALAEKTGRTLNCDFHLTKRLPYAAGLGGGSSDAATTLLLLANHWKIDRPALEEIAPALGADVPVCLHRQSARMTGIGERIEPLDQPVRAKLAGSPLLLVNPNQPVETKDVFAAYAQQPHTTYQDEPDPRLSHNDLAQPALDICPAIGAVLGALAMLRTVTQFGMSGSGPSCFAKFASMADCRTAARSISLSQPDWWVQPTTLI